MKLHSLSRGSIWHLRLLAVALAVVGPLGLSGASLALARDESSSMAHAERSGIALHHGHDEATCAACTALSFHASVVSDSQAASGEAISQLDLPTGTVIVVASGLLLAIVGVFKSAQRA